MKFKKSTNEDFYFYGYIGITPIGTLENTAKIIGHQLGLIFDEEISGRYEEFPAFIVYALGIEWALLGIPDERDSLMNETIDYFVLQFSTKFRPRSEQETKINLSAYIVELLSEVDVHCWAL